MNKLLILLISIISLSASCDKPPPGAKVVYSFWIQNNTGNGVTFLVSETYPDTLMPNTENLLSGASAGQKVPIDYQDKLEEVFANLPADTLSIFFINSDTLIEYGFSQIREDYNIMERRDISLQDLKSNRYIIHFP